MLGTAKRRQQAQAASDAGALSDAILLDLSGNEVRLGDTWEERPALLVFLRHYG